MPGNGTRREQGARRTRGIRPKIYEWIWGVNCGDGSAGCQGCARDQGGWAVDFHAVNPTSPRAYGICRSRGATVVLGKRNKALPDA